MSRHLWNARGAKAEEVDLPVPRPAPEEVEPSLPTEEITEELPRYVEPEPTEPALTMLSRGRHGMTRDKPR